MLNVRFDLVFETSNTAEFIAQLKFDGVMRVEDMCDCTVVRICCKEWTPPKNVPVPANLIGGVLVFNIGCRLDIVCDTFPGMYYKIDENAVDVTAAFSRTGILPNQMQTVKLHFRIPKETLSVDQRIAAEHTAARFVDALFITAFNDHRNYDATDSGVDYELAFSPGKPWEFAKNASIPETLTEVSLVYDSNKSDVFCRIRDDISIAFPKMQIRHHVDGSRIEVVLTVSSLTD